MPVMHVFPAQLILFIVPQLKVNHAMSIRSQVLLKLRLKTRVLRLHVSYSNPKQCKTSYLLSGEK